MQTIATTIDDDDESCAATVIFLDNRDGHLIKEFQLDAKWNEVL